MYRFFLLINYFFIKNNTIWRKIIETKTVGHFSYQHAAKAKKSGKFLIPLCFKGYNNFKITLNSQNSKIKILKITFYDLDHFHNQRYKSFIKTINDHHFRNDISPIYIFRCTIKNSKTFPPIKTNLNLNEFKYEKPPLSNSTSNEQYIDHLTYRST